MNIKKGQVWHKKNNHEKKVEIIKGHGDDFRCIELGLKRQKSHSFTKHDLLKYWELEEKETKQMIKAHILSIPFTGLGLHNGYRGDEWLKNRIKVFKEYVLRSLMRQSNMNFVIWCQFRPEERNNPIVQDLFQHMNKLEGLTTVFTYGGICLYDDKYPDKTARERLYNALKTSLPALIQHVDHADEVLLTCQPSDDIYAVYAFKDIQEHDFGETKATGYTKGYIIDYSTKRIAEYNPDTLPPFSTIRFPKEEFIDPERHFYWIGPYTSHEYVKDLGFKPLKSRGFMVGTHGANISTTWNIPYKGKEIIDGEKEIVMVEFGIREAQPIIMPLSTKLKIKRLLNKMPFNSMIKKVYYSLKINKIIHV